MFGTGEETIDGERVEDFSRALVLYRPLKGVDVPLFRGEQGASVAALQEGLYRMGLIPRNEIDGKYGRKTEAAVMVLQRECGLEPTGFLDDEEAYFLTRFLETQN